MSEMIATANAKSIEEIKSFLSRQKEVYKIPYETHPADRPRQCVFGGTSNALDFLPLDRSGNRRFIPIQVCPEQAETHILEDEAASRAYLNQVWAEAMEIYKSGRWKLTFSPEMVRYLKERQRDFMPEDTKAGMIQAFLDSYPGDTVCSKQLYKEALNHDFDEPKQWEIREINEIMNQCATGWNYFSNPRMFAGYGRQKGWEREQKAEADPVCDRKMKQQFIGLQHCKCGMSWKKDIGFFFCSQKGEVMLKSVETVLEKPLLYKKTEGEFWNDEHISKQMLKPHLNPEFDGASRKLLIKKVTDYMQLLYENNLPLIKKFIKSFAAYEPMEDLLQESYFGLWQAVQYYETSANVRFMTYVEYWIRQSVQRYLEKCGSAMRIPSHNSMSMGLFLRWSISLYAGQNYRPGMKSMKDR